MIIPKVPVSFDESIIYGGLVDLYMCQPKKISSIGNKCSNFWNDFEQRNKCLGKNASKMLCTLFVNKANRESHLAFLQRHKHVWEDKAKTEWQKITTVFNNKTIDNNMSI